MLGEEYVNRALANANSFNAPLQELVTEYCCGKVWGRQGLDRKQRSMLNLAMMSVLNRPHELKAHIGGALTNGVTPQEICELFLQVMIYAGIPAAVDNFRIANEVFCGERRATNLSRSSFRSQRGFWGRCCIAATSRI